jgi:hypothetical protein
MTSFIGKALLAVETLITLLIFREARTNRCASATDNFSAAAALNFR